MKIRLDQFSNSWYKPGGNSLKRICWYFTNVLFFNSYLFPFYGLKRFLLRLFGAEIGNGVKIKPKVNIKYPWKLKIGEHSWIGEEVWIDNLAEVHIGAHVCISQGAYLLTGNHNFTLKAFDLIVKPIQIEHGCWLGAKSIVTPGTIVHEYAVLSVNSVAGGTLDAFGIYRGNPATKVKQRIISA